MSHPTIANLPSLLRNRTAKRGWRSTKEATFVLPCAGHRLPNFDGSFRAVDKRLSHGKKEKLFESTNVATKLK